MLHAVLNIRVQTFWICLSFFFKSAISASFSTSCFFILKISSSILLVIYYSKISLTCKLTSHGRRAITSCVYAPPSTCANPIITCFLSTNHRTDNKLRQNKDACEKLHLRCTELFTVKRVRGTNVMILRTLQCLKLCNNIM